MSSSDVIRIVTERVHEIADKADWQHLTIPQRKKFYEEWTEDPQIGGLLSRVMEPHRIRVYLKDTVMKNYSRKQKPNLQNLLEGMSLEFLEINKQFIKPEALLLDQTKLYTLTIAKEWKGAIMSAFERGYEIGSLEINTVFITDHTNGRFVDKYYRDLIDCAARKLGIQVHWVN